MIKLFRIIKAHRYFLLFVLLFAYMQSIYIRIVIRRVIDAYVFTPESAFATLISVGILFFIILFFVKSRRNLEVFRKRDMLRIFGFSLFSFLIIMKVSGLLIAVIFDTVERNFNQETFVLSLFSNVLDGCIYGSFFLAYYYFSQNQKKQEQLIVYNQAIAESKINQLKTQLNPHFLFNNLNVLDQLIDEDKNKASDFLNEFADIYRYVLQASDKKIISIKEELNFAEHYFSMIQHKYGDAYQLVIENRNSEGYIAPLTLQLLIENAVQHNLGTVENPIYIKINIEENLNIINNYVPKRNAKITSGRALNNLVKQYELLTNKPIEILKSDQSFSVILPIINKCEQ